MEKKYNLQLWIKRIVTCLLICCIIYLLTFPIIKTEVIIKEIEKPIRIEVEKLVEVEKIVEVEPTYAFNITSSEREMLARLVYQEANTESIDCQKAIVEVVINRWKSGYWGDSLYDVIYAEGAFSPAYLIPQTTPTETNYHAVDEVLKNGCTITEPYVMYFRASYGFSQIWDGYEEYIQIDNTYFGYMNQNKN